MTTLLPVLALVFNACVWGLTWWPLRALGALGLHPLWSTALFHAVAFAALAAWRPRAARAVGRSRGLLALALAAGSTNVCFNWGVATGDVVRVVLLFYLMPVWVAALAWPLLGERPTAAALVRVALAIAGVGVVLHAPGGTWLPVPQGLADWLGLAGGVCFALTNILLRRLAAASGEERMLAMFGGATVTAGAAALVATALGAVAAPAVGAMAAQGAVVTVALGVVGMAVAMVAGNSALQYGAARLPAGVTSLVMLTEVVVATLSAAAWGDAVLSWRTAAGAALVLVAAAWASAPRRRTIGA